MPRIKKPQLKPRADGRYACWYKGKIFYGKTSDEALQKREEYRELAEAGMQAENVDGSYACCYNGMLFYGQTSEEAIRRREEFKGLAKESKKPTVYEYARRWLPVAKVGIRAHTYNGYATMMDYLVDVVGEKKLADVKPSDIKSVYSTHYIGYSDSHIRHARNLYTAMFDSAVDDGYIYSNPCRTKAAKPHKGTAGTHRAITPEERYYIETTDHPVRRIAMLMLYAGLRDGEAIPIDVDRDIDFVNKTIHVRYFRHIEHGQAIVEMRGKTDRSVRDIKLFPQLEKVLDGHHGLAVSMQDGSVLSDSAWRSAWSGFVRAIERRMNGGCQKRWYGRRKEDLERKAKYDSLMAEGKKAEAEQYALPPWREFTVRPYDLRHSFCVMCRDLGIDIHVCMRWLSHSDPTMILRIYDHVSDERINAEFKKICDDYNKHSGENIVKTIVNS